MRGVRRSVLRSSRALAIAWIAAAVLTGPGCQEHQVSQKDLQTMKKDELQAHPGTLTSEEEMRILGIQARTREDFDRQVKRILAARSKTAPPTPVQPPQPGPTAQ
jgi:hypothetical protein